MQKAEDLFEPGRDHRRRSNRADRHTTSQLIHQLDPEELDAAVPTRTAHDIGHPTSRRPTAPPKPGRRGGFKVWKTPFWKRRTTLRQQKALAERRDLGD